jgi:hypothetical protein
MAQRFYVLPGQGNLVCKCGSGKVSQEYEVGIIGVFEAHQKTPQPPHEGLLKLFRSSRHC